MADIREKIKKKGNVNNSAGNEDVNNDLDENEEDDDF